MRSIFTSNNPCWQTPPSLFRQLDERFHFTLDPCSSHENALCEKHYTEEDDGLSKSWKGERVFMNPPYGRGIKDWCRKAWEESCNGALVVGLIPVRADTEWWQTYVCGKASVTFIKGRLHFGGGCPKPTKHMQHSLRQSLSGMEVRCLEG